MKPQAPRFHSYLEKLLPLYDPTATSDSLELAVQVGMRWGWPSEITMLYAGLHSGDKVLSGNSTRIFIAELIEHLPEMSHMLRSERRHFLPASPSSP